MDSELIIRNNSENFKFQIPVRSGPLILISVHSRVILVGNENELFHIYINPTAESKISAGLFHV